jgi:hypothetical protein
MNSNDPPPLATWLLQRFGAKEALVGDLIEQYQRGRSGVWYWRQALRAILVGAYHDLRGHKWLALRTILAAYGSWVLYLLFLQPPVRTVWGRIVWIRILPPFILEVVFGLIALGVPAAAMGWIIARLNGRHKAAMVFAVAVFVLLPVQVPELIRRLANAVNDPRYVAALSTQLASMIIVFGSVLLGGLSVPPDKQHLSLQRPVSA